MDVRIAPDFWYAGVSWNADVCLQTQIRRTSGRSTPGYFRRSKIMGKGDNRQKNDKKNKKAKKDVKKPGIATGVKKA
jgi:hypothetical protein